MLVILHLRDFVGNKFSILNDDTHCAFYFVQQEAQRQHRYRTEGKRDNTKFLTSQCGM